jgi:hypothetical protein
VFFVPTFASLERLGRKPPAGRGGAVHRYIQQVITNRAIAQGYTAKIEYDLGNGGSVDVHLEKDRVRIAVEIAAVSKLLREIAHIKNCLVGYDRVYVVFVDQRLLERTTAALAGFSDEELGKIRLVHLRNLSQVG